MPEKAPLERRPLARAVPDVGRRALVRAVRPASIRSIAADDLAADDLLYDDGRVTVMPSWLEIDGRESYAVRSIVRLSLSESAPPRGVAATVSLVALVLAVVSGAHLLRDSLPGPVAWLALVASLALLLVASHVAFVRPSDYTLDIQLVDGTPIRLVRSERASLLELHRALRRAMERQRGGS